MSVELQDMKALLIVSPHLDDGVLSVGGLVEYALAIGVRVVIATTFARDSPPAAELSPFAVELHGRWNRGPNPYAGRRAEDVAAIELLGAELRHAPLHEALYRTDAAGSFLYPTQESIFGPPAAGDEIGEALTALLDSWIDEFMPDLVLAPLGVGRHVDHVIVTSSLHRLATSRPIDVALYEDMPYATGIVPVFAPDTVEAALERTPWPVAGAQLFPVGLDAKLAAISAYASQIAEIFPDGRDVRSVVGRYMLDVGATLGVRAERLWLTRRQPGGAGTDRG